MVVYSLYLDNGKLSFAACANGKRDIITSPTPVTKPIDFEASGTAKGDMFLKVNKKLVARTKKGAFMQREPSESIQIGADLGEAVGVYQSPNAFEGSIDNLVFKYPNGS